ncbi:MAG: hypothetical protein EA394_08675 [Bacteroidia bacterium]|nr:MAG: hypothetical protein EA394_08675 [Bacteroidia bacterium]
MLYSELQTDKGWPPFHPAPKSIATKSLEKNSMISIISVYPNSSKLSEYKLPAQVLIQLIGLFPSAKIDTLAKPHH